MSIVKRRETERLREERARELREKAEQLIAPGGARSHVFANLSYELRTLLTLTVARLEDTWRGRHGELSEGATRALDDALLDTRRLLRLADRLHDMAKLEAGDAGFGRTLAPMPDPAVSDVMVPRTEGIELLTRAENRAAGRRAAGRRAAGRRAAGRRAAGRRALRDRLSALAAAAGDSPTSDAGDDGGEPEKRAWQQHVEAIIQTRLEEESFNVSALAAAAGLDRSHLFRRSKALLGLTPSAWLMRRRLERAARLLAEGAGSCREIGYAVGFKSLSHFTARFRDRYGATPRRFAEAHRPNVTNRGR